MTIFQIAAVLMTLTALFSCANHRVFRLPTTIGVQGLTLRRLVLHIVGQGAGEVSKVPAA
jgi:hypothetical protein